MANVYVSPYTGQPYYAAQPMIQQPLQQPIQQNIQQPIQQQIQQPLQQPNNQQVQNGGFIVVASDDDIKRYPVAPGNVITFKIDGKPVIVEKSMGYSQFDSPKYKRYKMIEEDMPDNQKDADEPEEKVDYALKSDYEEINDKFHEIQKKINKFMTDTNDSIEEYSSDIDSIRKEITTLKNQMKELKRPVSKRKEDSNV